MFKKIKTLILSILVLFGLASCIQTQPTTKYSFNEITNKEIENVSRVLINNGPMTSAQFSFEGDYEKILDVDYMLSDMPYNEIRKIYEEYRFWLHLEFDNTKEGINFYVLDYKLYYFNNETLYESLNKVDYSDFVTSVPPIEEVHTTNVFVMYDYGMHISGELTTLLDGNFVWFDPSDYGIDKLIAGDELVIEYTGQFICEESYPGNVAANLMHIQSIEVIEADIVEFTVSAVPGGNELNLVPVDHKYNNYNLSNDGYVVSLDETFKKYDEYPENTLLYASMPKTTGLIRVDGLYDYNPREKVIPTGQYELSLVDKGNDIIDELSHDAGMYTPGTMLEFYSHPIMDVDLAMYVNDEFYKIQDTIRVNDEYMWKYTYVMPSKDIVIEFKTISIEYTTVRNVLNIPDLSINDIDEVRYEHGYIGVAPGRLTNISYSNDMEDKNMLLSLLDMPVYEDITNNWQITGGGYKLYSIFTTNQRYDIEISNGYISYNQKHYKFLGEYVSFEYPSSQAHSFITYLDNATVYRLDWVYSDLVYAEKICEINNIGNLEFVECDWTSDNKASHEIVTEFGSLYVYDSDVFYYDDTYYKITNDNFSFYEMFN